MNLQDLVDEALEAGKVPGVVALLADGDDGDVAAGVRTPAGEPLARDALFRIASTTKSVVAAATMVPFLAAELPSDLAWLHVVERFRGEGSTDESIDDRTTLLRESTEIPLIGNGDDFARGRAAVAAGPARPDGPTRGRQSRPNRSRV